MNANPPDIHDLLERSGKGELYALAQLYGHAAAWIRGGMAPPAPQANWLADRLDAIRSAIWNAAVQGRDPKDFENQIAKAAGALKSRRGRRKRTGPNVRGTNAAIFEQPKPPIVKRAICPK
jgi:hypothetical protein